MVVSVFFHKTPLIAVVYRLRLAFEGVGLYFVCRAFLQSRDDLHQVSVIMALTILPLALGMAAEQVTGHNPFAFFGSAPEAAVVRNGVFRAQGPYGSPILA